MAKKLDLSGVKEFLFKYGERVALFTCMGVAALLIVSGLVGAMGPGTPTGEGWDKTISEAAIKLKRQLPLGGDPNPDNVKQYSKTEPFNWQRVDIRGNPGPYWNISENLDTRRTNPLILRVLPDIDEVQNIQFDYLERGHLGYEIVKLGKESFKVLTVAGGDGGAGDKPGPGGVGGIPGAGIPGAMKDGAGGGLNLATVLQPRHMLVVTAIFPMKAQVDEFLKALRITSVSELQHNKELPRILGINVWRDELVPGAEKPTRKELIVFNNDQLIIDPKLDKDMQQAIYNTSNPKALRPLIHAGLVTPLPNLPEGVKYPVLRIKSDNDRWPPAEMLAAVDDAMPAGQPMGGVPGGPLGGRPGGPMPNKGGGGSILGSKKGDGGNTMPGGADAPAEAKTDYVPLKKLAEKDKELYDRLSGIYNIFHPYGQFTDAKDAAAAGSVEPFGFATLGEGNAGGAGGPPGVPPGGQGQPGGKTTGSGKPLAPGMKDNFGDKPGGNPGVGAKPGGLEIYDAIARFVDVDLKPGSTYTYHIQVRVLNPNFGKPELVAQQNWAAIKELVSGWTSTKPFTVPDTFHLFAVDQFLVDQLGEKDPKKNFTREKHRKEKDMDGNHAVLQLQRWFDTDSSREAHRISDWANAERLVVRRGEPIGVAIGPMGHQVDMVLEIPTWSKGKGSFEMRTTVQGKNSRQGVPLDFVPPAVAADGKRIDGIAPLLVDVEGGRKNGAKVGLPGVVEEVAQDVLILTPDGRLIVHNSRADMDAKIDDGSEEGTSRQKRVVDWRERNHAVLNPK